MTQVPQTTRTGQPDLTLDHQNVTPRTPSLILTNRYVDAVTFVGTLHATQVRKGSDIPYISHLLGVSALIIEARGDEDQAIAGLLHDTAEDCGGAPVLAVVEQRFGHRVAETVRGCSDSLAADPRHKKPYVERKGEYLEHLLHASDDVLIVTAADKLHNARAIWRDLHVEGSWVLDRFNRPDLISWYYRGVFEAIDGRAPQALTQPLGEVVQQLTDHLDQLGFPLITV